MSLCNSFLFIYDQQNPQVFQSLEYQRKQEKMLTNLLARQMIYRLIIKVFFLHFNLIIIRPSQCFSLACFLRIIRVFSTCFYIWVFVTTVLQSWRLVWIPFSLSPILGKLKSFKSWPQAIHAHHFNLGFNL